MSLKMIGYEVKKREGEHELSSTRAHLFAAGTRSRWSHSRSISKVVTTVTLLAIALLALSSEARGAMIAQTPWRINGGKADFGSGSHVAGSPTGDGFVTWDLRPVNGVLTARATVTGRLYYDSLSGPGTARLLIEFKSVTAENTLVTVATRTITRSGPGGDANLAANQIAVNETFAARDLHTVVVHTFEVRSDGSLANGFFIVDPTDSLWHFSPKINNGTSDFGSGNHSFGSPEQNGFVAFFRRLPNETLTPETPLGSMLGVVSGTLYWDAAFSSGTAVIAIDFQDANGTTLATRSRGVTGPGGNANNSSNQKNIDVTFASPALFQIRLRVGTDSNGNLVNVASRTFRIQSSAAGTFELVPSTAEVAVHERLNYAFSWTVPAPGNWRDLKSLKLRIRGEEGVIFSVLFDEASETFALVNEDNGKTGHAFPAGSNAQLKTSHVTLYLADTTVVGSGPTGPEVTLNLSLGFKPHARGKTFIVEVAASDDDGNEDTFTAAGSLTVTPVK